MKTLYELLGALPDDDADGLREAFRKAAKASHPDVNAADPDAPLRFRQVMRANAILSDPQQRAAYDKLMVVTAAEAVAAARPPPMPQPHRQQQSRSPKPAPGPIRRAIRRIAFDTITVASLSTMSIGGYLLFDRLSKAAADPSGNFEVAARPNLADAVGPANVVSPVNVVGPPMRPFETTRQDDPAGAPTTFAAVDTATPSKPVAPAVRHGNVPPAKVTLNGARSVRRAFAGLHRRVKLAERSLRRTRTASTRPRPEWALSNSSGN
jgi:curved DNA-binding protein CbpA